MHVPVDPLFLVIPIVLSLISSATHFQPLSDLVAQASVNPDFALPEPFSREAIKGGGFNEDVGRLLAIKSVRRVFKLCCEKKGTTHTLRLTLACHAMPEVGRWLTDPSSGSHRTTLAFFLLL